MSKKGRKRFIIAGLNAQTKVIHFRMVNSPIALIMTAFLKRQYCHLSRWNQGMSEEQFAYYSTVVLVGYWLIAFMAYIIYDLAKSLNRSLWDDDSVHWSLYRGGRLHYQDHHRRVYGLIASHGLN